MSLFGFGIAIIVVSHSDKPWVMTALLFAWWGTWYYDRG